MDSPKTVFEHMFPITRIYLNLIGTLSLALASDARASR
jgi:hypothetical protein